MIVKVKDYGGNWKYNADNPIPQAATKFQDFLWDITKPTSAVTTPSSVFVKTFTSIVGTADDAGGAGASAVDRVEVAVQRLDGIVPAQQNKYWDWGNKTFTLDNTGLDESWTNAGTVWSTNTPTEIRISSANLKVYPRAKDKATNYQTDFANGGFTFTIDDVAPSVVFLSTGPQDGAYYNEATLPAIAGTATDGSGLSGVKEVRIVLRSQGYGTWDGSRGGDDNDWDGSNAAYWILATGLTSWTTSFPPLNQPGANNRKYTLWVSAEDNATNVSTRPSAGNITGDTNPNGAAALQFYYDNSNPVSYVQTPLSGAYMGRPLLTISGRRFGRRGHTFAESAEQSDCADYRSDGSFYSFSGNNWAGLTIH